MDELEAEDMGWPSLSKELKEETMESELEVPKCSATGWGLPREDPKRKKGVKPGTELILTGSMTFSKKPLLQALVCSSASNIPSQRC